MSTRALKVHGAKAVSSGVETLSDEVLVAAALDGDEPAFRDLASRHRNAAIREAARIVGSKDAENVVKDSLLMARRALSSLRDRTSFSRWLMAITRWRALRVGRNESRHLAADIALDERALDTLSELACAPRNRGVANDLLLGALESIPPEYGEVIRYHFLHGLPHQKIAEFLEVPLSTVKWRCYRGTEILRRTLLPEPTCATECLKGCAKFSKEAVSVAFQVRPASFFEVAAARLETAIERLVPGAITLLERLDVTATSWMADHGIQVLRISLGVIFFWFGALKFFPGFSPAEELATRTISGLTFGLVPPNVSILVLATWECAIGLGLIFGVFLRATLVLLFLQMLGTFSPLVLFPHEVFTHIPNAPTLEGQYIIKNLVLISAGLVIGGTVRGGAIEADPEVIRLGHQTQTTARDA